MIELVESFQIGVLEIHFFTQPGNHLKRHHEVRLMVLMVMTVCLCQVFAEGAHSFLSRTRSSLHYDLSWDSNTASWQKKDFFRGIFTFPLVRR